MKIYGKIFTIGVLMRKILFIFLILILFLASCDSGVAEKEIPVTETEAETFETQTEKESEPTIESHMTESDKISENMTISEKVGQLFLVRNPRTEEDGIRLIEEKKVGGIIFFAVDFKYSSPEKFRSMIESYNEKSSLPLLTAVDEEGGTVCRASIYEQFRDERFASPAELYAEGGFGLIESDAAEKSRFLKDLGINLNLAPVADISTNAEDFIHKRSLGLSRDETAAYVEKVVKVMNDNQILSALKHFPGYGNNEDTHTGIAYDKRSLDYIRENDLVPFEMGIKAGAPIVMVSHNIVECIDSEMPASLSENVIRILRNEMGFEGVIMTDDLSMDAIGDFTESGEAAVLAILAGADLLCCSDVETQYYAVLDAVENGRISDERLDESVERIIKMKLENGIMG